MNLKKFLLIILSFIFLVSCKTNDSDTIRLHGAYKVVRVVDGDTIIIKKDEEKVRVRLIGIDTPESVHKDKRKNTKKGKLASEYTKRLLKNQEVYLEYDEELKDKYDRTLAYVYLSDKETMVNKLILQNGYAKAIKIKPNIKYYDEFYKIYKQAKADKIGIWKSR